MTHTEVQRLLIEIDRVPEFAPMFSPRDLYRAELDLRSWENHRARRRAVDDLWKQVANQATAPTHKLLASRGISPQPA